MRTPGHRDTQTDAEMQSHRHGGEGGEGGGAAHTITAHSYIYSVLRDKVNARGIKGGRNAAWEGAEERERDGRTDGRKAGGKRERMTEEKRGREGVSSVYLSRILAGLISRSGGGKGV